MKICPACGRENADNVSFCAQCGAALPAAEGAAAAPGQAAPYYPPPPVAARRGRSPWLWVGLGCGLFTLVLFGGCATLGLVGGRWIAQEMGKPISEQEVLASLEGVPIYPGAQLDKETTKAIRATFGIVGSVSGGKIRFDAAVFRAPAAPGKLITWYDAKLRAGGWRPMAQPPAGFTSRQQGITEQRQYEKNRTQLVVQAGTGRSGRRSGGGGDADDAGGGGDFGSDDRAGSSTGGGTGAAAASMLILTRVAGLPEQR